MYCKSTSDTPDLHVTPGGSLRSQCFYAQDVRQESSAIAEQRPRPLGSAPTVVVTLSKHLAEMRSAEIHANA